MVTVKFPFYFFALGLIFFVLPWVWNGGVLTGLGNFLEIAIPLLAFTAGVYQGDREGLVQCFRTFFGTVLLAYAIKYAVAHSGLGLRPNGETGSFPSGHTAISFQGALFLWVRYGRRWMPIVALAALTAYSRIHGHYHHWRDILAGLIIALSVNRLWVRPWQNTATILP
jgi:membrane-associated phospholipid phosphatase